MFFFWVFCRQFRPSNSGFYFWLSSSLRRIVWIIAGVVVEVVGARSVTGPDFGLMTRIHQSGGRVRPMARLLLEVDIAPDVVFAAVHHDGFDTVRSLAMLSSVYLDDVRAIALLGLGERGAE